MRVAPFVVAALSFAGLTAASAVAAPEVTGAPVRDPFQRYVRIDCMPSCVVGPGVFCMGLDELSLKAVVVGVASPRAAFEDRAGRSHVLKVGDVVSGLQLAALRSGEAVFRPVGRVGSDVVVRLRAAAPVAAPATANILCTDG